MTEPLVGIIMGSTSDWETMRHAADTLDQLGVAARDARSSRRIGRPRGFMNMPIPPSSAASSW